MRILTNTLANLISLAAFILLSTQLSANDIDLRFNTAHYDEAAQELYVDIEVQYTQSGQLVLAGQNYRFYYDSEVLSLDVEEIVSKLPANTFGELTVEDHLKGIEADHVNQLIFDDNLGFVNFSINLSDNLDGGLPLREEDGWVAVITLKFDILKADERYDIVWGREGVSDLYATAFVEMAQWVSATKLDIVHINYYGDLTSEESVEQAVLGSDVTIGPNPTTDYVNIVLDKEVKNRATITLRDLGGRQVKREVLGAGSIEKRIDLSDLTPSSYIVEIIDADRGMIHNSQIIMAK